MPGTVKTEYTKSIITGECATPIIMSQYVVLEKTTSGVGVG